MSEFIDLPGKQQRGWTGWNWSLWYRWILANAVGEGVGLGLTLTMGFVLFAGAEKTLRACSTVHQPLQHVLLLLTHVQRDCARMGHALILLLLGLLS